MLKNSTKHAEPLFIALRDDFDFHIVNFPLLPRDIPSAPD